MNVNAFLSKEETENAKKTAQYNIHHTKVEVKMVEVIMVTTTEGGIDADDPFRKVTRYFEKDGSLICKIDPVDQL